MNSQTVIKVNLEHNISTTKIPQVRYDLNQTILSIKQNVQKRYGSDVPYMRLALKDEKGKLLTSMDENNRSLGFYGAKNNYIILVTDLNPNSIHKEIEDLASIPKYTISQEDYNKLPENARKWKKQFLKSSHDHAATTASSVDQEYMKELAECIKAGNRCKIVSGARGEVRYVGKVPQLGVGYFVGVNLDEPAGNCNGTVSGFYYFNAEDKRGIFLRPDMLEVGEFPILDASDEI